jgi:hypothetical protein
MKKYVEGVVESIERRGITKRLTLELSGKDRMKDIIFFEDVISVRSKGGSLHSVKIEDDNAVSVGEEVFLFNNDENVAVKIYKEKEKLHEDLDTSMTDMEILKNKLKDEGFIATRFLAFIALTLFMSLPIILLLICTFDSQNYINAIFGGSIGFSSIVSAVLYGYSWREFSLKERKEKNQLEKMVSDFRESQAEQGVEVNQKSNVVAR